MRTIKFRGRSLHKQKDADGIFQYVMLYGNLIHRGGDCFYIAFYETDYTGNARLSTYLVDADTIGEFTGVQDCNGCDIYEGDIVELDNGQIIGEVVFDDASFKIKTQFDNFWLTLKSNPMRVIGNIHQKGQKQ
jgi:hypothetical protein